MHGEGERGRGRGVRDDDADAGTPLTIRTDWIQLIVVVPIIYQEHE